MKKIKGHFWWPSTRPPVQPVKWKWPAGLGTRRCGWKSNIPTYQQSAYSLGYPSFLAFLFPEYSFVQTSDFQNSKCPIYQTSEFSIFWISGLSEFHFSSYSEHPTFKISNPINTKEKMRWKKIRAWKKMLGKNFWV